MHFYQSQTLELLGAHLARNVITSYSIHYTKLYDQLDLDLETKKYLKGQIERITEELRRMSHEEPWAEQMLYLMQIPGFGVVTGMTVLAAIGDIARFENPKRLASYSGLVPGLESYNFV